MAIPWKPNLVELIYLPLTNTSSEKWQFFNDLSVPFLITRNFSTMEHHSEPKAIALQLNLSAKWEITLFPQYYWHVQLTYDRFSIPLCTIFLFRRVLCLFYVGMTLTTTLLKGIHELIRLVLLSCPHKEAIKW